MKALRDSDKPHVITDKQAVLSLSVASDIRLQKEIYDRYKGFIYHVVLKSVSGFGLRVDIASDVVQSTFLKFFLSITDLSKRIASMDEKETKVYLKGWLSKVGRNELIDYLRKNPDENHLYIEGNDEAVEEIGDSNESFERTIEKDILDDALTSLTEREKHILLVYMSHFDPMDPNRHLPDSELSALCETYSTNPANLRKIKSRALKKLKSKIIDGK